MENNHAYVVIMSSTQEKRPSVDAEVRSSSEGSGVVQDVARMSKWEYFEHYVTSRDGWLGDYVSPRLPGKSVCRRRTRRDFDLPSQYRITPTLLHPTSGL